MDRNKSGDDFASLAQDSNTEISGLWECYNPTTYANATLTTRLEELMQDYTDLQAEHESLHSLCKVLKERNEWLEQSSKEHQDESRKLQIDSAGRSCFLMVIIDGNDLMFDEHLLRAGFVGGEQAARTLHTGILKWSSDYFKGGPPDIRLSVRVFADAKSIANRFYRAGTVGSPSIVGDFLDGFCHYNALFDVVDVGKETGTADAKFNALFNLHLHDVPCRQIFLGFNENEGYTRMLQYFSTDDDAWNRITLLRSTAATENMAILPFKTVYISGIFEKPDPALNTQSSCTSYSGQLNGDHTSDPKPRSHCPPAVESSDTSETTTGEVAAPPSQAASTQEPTPKQKTGPTIHEPHGRDNTIIPPNTRSKASAERPGPGGNWSKVVGKAAALPFKDMTRSVPFTKATGPFVMQNKDGQRLDTPMEYNHERVAELKKMKYCNQHYIGKGCCHWAAHNGACPHRHEPKLSRDDLKWLRVVARETVCRKGTKCLDFGCIYGHHCPYPKEGRLCTNGPACRFPPQMHEMDTEVAKYVTG